MRHHVLAALGAALLVTAPFAARAEGSGPDFKEKCQKAAAKQLGLAKKDIKVIGKHKNADGYMMVDFHVSDGRQGVCRHEGNGKVYDVKVEGTATNPPASAATKKK
jgi:hypothetical protein